MRLLTYEIPYSLGPDEPGLNLCFLGDTHRLHANHDEEAFRRDVARIEKDPFARWYHLGDVTDMIFPGDRRFKSHEFDKRYLEDVENASRLATDDVAEILEPIRDKCLGVHTGNHDDTGASRYYFQAARALADRLKVPYCGARALTRLLFRRGGHSEQVVVHTMHGSGGGSLAGAPANYLEKQMANVDADVHACGHFHRRTVVRRPMVRPTRKGTLAIHKRERVGVACGSYLESYVEGPGDYAETSGMTAWQGGMVVVTVRPEPFSLEVSA